jgi:hypothetical protein
MKKYPVKNVALASVTKWIKCTKKSFPGCGCKGHHLIFKSGSKPKGRYTTEGGTRDERLRTTD